MSKSSAITASMVVALLALMIIFQAYYESEEAAKERAIPLAEIPLVDDQGRQVNLKDYAGRWLLLFFGYRSCPDVCPMTLSYLRREWQELGAPSDAVQVVFVSVDPKRDEPHLLKQYVESFSEDFVGLTGDRKNLESLVRRLGAFFFYEDSTSELSYLVNHSGSFFILGPDGKLVKSISPPHDKGLVVSTVQQLVAKGML